MSGRMSRTPIASSTRRVATSPPSARPTVKAPSPVRTEVTRSLTTRTESYGASCSRPIRSSSSGGVPSRVKQLCAVGEGALRGAPASTTSTRRRDRPSTSAALSPAAPPPTTTTSIMERSLDRRESAGHGAARVPPLPSPIPSRAVKPRSTLEVRDPWAALEPSRPVSGLRQIVYGAGRHDRVRDV